MGLFYQNSGELNGVWGDGIDVMVWGKGVEARIAELKSWLCHLLVMGFVTLLKAFKLSVPQFPNI